MTDYYASLASHPDPARQVGWESRLAQLTRFAAVAATLRPEDAVVDVGAGLGDLTRYLAHTHPRARCTGVEARPAFVARAACMAPPVTLTLGRLGDGLTLPEADVVVAIGALVDGRPLTDGGTRLGRVRAMLAALLGAARRHVVAIFAAQEGLEADPLRAADPALGGLRVNELSWILPDSVAAQVVTDVLPSDLVVVLAKDAAELPDLPSGEALRDAARNHPMAPACPIEALRFAILARERARAETLLASGRRDPRLVRDPAWRLLEARYALLSDSPQ